MAMKTIISALFLSFALALIPIAAEARVDILPRKILIEDRQRSADITIMNLGDETETMRLSLISYRQKEDGTYETLETPLNPAFDPATAVRFSPRQFTLPPNGRQKIRLSIQRPADLPDGEYRFHVKAVSYDNPVEAQSGIRTPKRGNSLALEMNIAVVIPVIVRKGDLTSTAKIENVTLLAPSENEYGKPALKYDIVRTGTGGVMGTLLAFHETPGQEPAQIAITSNLNVFSELDRRTVIVPMEKAPAAGNIRLRYTSDYGDKGVIDEVVIQR